MYVGGYVGSKIPEAFSIGVKFVSDSATGSLTSSIQANLTILDSATGSLSGVVPILPIQEIGSGDTPIVVPSLSVEDNASGIFSSVKVSLPIIDSAVGSLVLSVPVISIQESGSGKTPIIVPSFSVTDNASGISGISPLLLVADSAIGNTIKTSLVISLVDSADGELSLTRVWNIIFEYSGTLDVGDVFEVDGIQYLVKKNDNNARSDFSGEYPVLEIGDNRIGYDDLESSRSIELEIIKEDQHI